jgi:hypothetical protein
VSAPGHRRPRRFGSPSRGLRARCLSGLGSEERTLQIVGSSDIGRFWQRRPQIPRRGGAAPHRFDLKILHELGWPASSANPTQTFGLINERSAEHHLDLNGLLRQGLLLQQYVR